MRMIDIIAKKRNGDHLTKSEIEWFVTEYTAGEIPDYQAAVLLMAIYLQGMNREEIAALTLAMAESGDTVDLSVISGIKVDKHSTGGVGDKTTLIIAPVVAACGVPVAKMSGRGLGHTGGTVDKLEAIPNYQTAMDQQQLIQQVQQIGIALVSQSGNLAPADKKLYALRDTTATVESIPLIAASIMSKKLAAGADAILLDVKIGSGAFMKTLEDGKQLAEIMVQIGEHLNRKTLAILTNMNLPLGMAIGNSLEVIEAAEVLLGKGQPQLEELCLELAAGMLCLAKKGSLTECRVLAKQAIENKTALKKFRELIEAQGGDPSFLEDFSKLPLADAYPFVMEGDGYLAGIDTEKCGKASCVLGAGRERKEDAVDFGAGILLKKQHGDYVKNGEVLALLYTHQKERLTEAEILLREAFRFDKKKPAEEKMILVGLE